MVVNVYIKSRLGNGTNFIFFYQNSFQKTLFPSERYIRREETLN